MIDVYDSMTSEVLKIISDVGIDDAELKQKVFGSIVVNLINLFIRTGEGVKLTDPILVTAIQFGCQLNKYIIRKILKKLNSLIIDQIKNNVNIEYVDFEFGQFLLVNNEVIFRSKKHNE